MGIRNSMRSSSSKLLAIVLLVLFALLTFAAYAQPSPGSSQKNDASEDLEKNERAGGDVVIDGSRVLTVYQSVGGFGPQDRARRIAERIVVIAKYTKINPDVITVIPRDSWTEIMAGDRLVMAVTDIDAKYAGKPRELLANECAGAIRVAIAKYRRDHSWNSVVKEGLAAVGLTAVLTLIGFAIHKTRSVIRNRVQAWLRDRIAREEKSALHIAFTYLGTFVFAVGAILRWILILVVLQVYITAMFGIFPATRGISIVISKWIFNALSSFGVAVVNYLPNFFIIVVISLIASSILRLIGMVFGEIERGTLTIEGFHTDWAAPTAKLLRLLVVVLAVMIGFPYFPGSKSPAFQGISIFLGVLVSLGSSSAVANAIAGIILTYMRSFLVGDWVKIGDVTGEIVEKNLLVTRVLTPKREVITIPNATVMSGAVMNFTLEAKKSGVIFHTTATIGYDAPWRTVHRLLIDAALATEHVRHEPRPFVLQTALNDFYVSYELNAYTDDPLKMQFIYSDLHQNIQDKFNAEGVEICSPHFASLRDGNKIAIPDAYIEQGYETPSFRIKEHRHVEVNAETVRDRT